MAGLDGLIIPGGESTTIGKGIESAELEPAIWLPNDQPHRKPCAWVSVVFTRFSCWFDPKSWVDPPEPFVELKR